MAFSEYTVYDYISSSQTDRERIAKIEILIDKLIDSSIKAATDSSFNIQEYQLDDGMVKIKTAYRTVEDIANGIKDLEKIKQMYMNRNRGHVVNLIDKNKIR